MALVAASNREQASSAKWCEDLLTGLCEQKVANFLECVQETDFLDVMTACVARA